MIAEYGCHGMQQSCVQSPVRDATKTKLLKSFARDFDFIIDIKHQQAITMTNYINAMNKFVLDMYRCPF